jgi:hypothetical protein
VVNTPFGKLAKFQMISNSILRLIREFSFGEPQTPWIQVHVCREANMEANGLSQQASGYKVKRGRFAVKPKPVVQ